jgi:hypothetical protein
VFCKTKKLLGAYALQYKNFFYQEGKSMKKRRFGIGLFVLALAAAMLALGCNKDDDDGGFSPLPYIPYIPPPSTDVLTISDLPLQSSVDVSVVTWNPVTRSDASSAMYSGYAGKGSFAQDGTFSWSTVPPDGTSYYVVLEMELEGYANLSYYKKASGVAITGGKATVSYSSFEGFGIQIAGLPLTLDAELYAFGSGGGADVDTVSGVTQAISNGIYRNRGYTHKGELVWSTSNSIVNDTITVVIKDGNNYKKAAVATGPGENYTINYANFVTVGGSSSGNGDGVSNDIDASLYGTWYEKNTGADLLTLTIDASGITWGGSSGAAVQDATDTLRSQGYTVAWVAKNGAITYVYISPAGRIEISVYDYEINGDGELELKATGVTFLTLVKQ